MRPRKEERNQRLWAERKKGRPFKELEQEFGLSNSRCVKIFHNQERWNEEKEIRNNIPKRMNHDEMIRYIEDHRRK